MSSPAETLDEDSYEETVDPRVAQHLQAALDITIEQAGLASMSIDRDRMLTSIDKLNSDNGTIVKEDVLAIIRNEVE